MMSKLFCSRQHLRIKIRAFVSFLLGGALLLGVPAARSADAPAWLTDAAKQALPASLPKDVVAVVLYSGQQTIVKPDGETETRYREVDKILRPEGKHYGTVAIYFSKMTPITYLKAWSIPADGKIYEVKERDAAETQIAGGEFYDDLKLKLLDIPASDAGNVVGYEYVQKDRPFIFLDTWDFQRRIPVLRAVYTLQLPDGWKYDSDWVNYNQLPPQSSASNEFTWQLNNILPVTVEDDMPPWRAVAGRLDVKYFSPQNTLQSEQAGSWHDLGLWYSSLVASRRDSTPEIQAEVASLTASAKTPLEKIQAITSYVQRHIRYVAIEIGIGGFQPHTAGDVFKNQYGDCKDKVTLLAAMLKDAGIDSYYSLAQIDRGIIQPQFASAGVFNHAILAIRLPSDVPTTNLYATVDDPKLSKLLFFDPTDEYTPVGYLPDTEQDNYVLVATPDGGQLVHLPILAPATNRLMRIGQFTVTSTGNLTGSVREIRWGGPAVESRAEYLQVAPKDRAKLVDQFLGTFLDNFQLQSASVGNLTQFDQSFTLDYTLAAPDYAKEIGDLIVLRPRVLGEKGSPDIASSTRKYPVEFSEATLQTDQFDFTLPAGYKVDDLPAPVKVDCGFISYQSHFSVSGNVLHYARSFQVNRVIVPVSDLAQLRSALGAIAADERSSVILKRSLN
jgi:transglutaminase-like putative cysteine protease